MSQISHTEFTVDLQLKSIEILRSSINVPPDIDLSSINYSFNINVDSKAESSKKLLFVIVGIDIRTEDQIHILGTFVASCIYSFENFDEIIKIADNGELTMPVPLVEIVNSITISTVRGIMFSTFRGTFLHNAILPIIDPRTFKKEELEATKDVIERKG